MILRVIRHQGNCTCYRENPDMLACETSVCHA
jgi:hypothetical protein